MQMKKVMLNKKLIGKKVRFYTFNDPIRGLSGMVEGQVTQVVRKNIEVNGDWYDRERINSLEIITQ